MLAQWLSKVTSSHAGWSKKELWQRDLDMHVLPPPQLPHILIKLRIRRYLPCNPFQSDGSLSGADKEQTLIWLRSFAEKQISVLTGANSLWLGLNKTCIEQDTSRFNFCFLPGRLDGLWWTDRVVLAFLNRWVATQKVGHGAVKVAASWAV